MSRNYLIVTVASFFLVLTSCGASKKGTISTRGSTLDGSGLGALECGEQDCERGDFSILTLEEDFEAGSIQTITWESAGDGFTYSVLVSDEAKCATTVTEVTDLSITETKITINEPGVYYVCLIATAGEDQAALEAKNSGKAISVTDSTRAVLNHGTSDKILFGERVVGSETPAALRLANQGAVDATEVSVTGLKEPMRFRGKNRQPGTFPGASSGTCETTIPAGTSCIVGLAFLPTKEGTVEVPVTVSYFDGKETISITLTASATALAPALLAFTPSGSHDFGNVSVGSSAEISLTLENKGKTEAKSLTPSIELPFAYKGNAFPGTGGTCGSTLAPAATCRIIVTFSPDSIDDFTTNLTINYFNGNAGSALQLTLDGAGT